MSSMSVKQNQRGIVNVLAIPLVTLIVLFLTVSGIAAWAVAGRSHYKNDSDQEAAKASQAAIKATQQTDAVKYAEEAKKPYDVYIGPSAYGNITVSYPKTWSSYVIESQSGGNPISGYFQPGFVPSITSQNNSFALRVDLVQTPYETVLSQFKSYVQSGKVTVAPYTLPKVPSVVGSRIEGQITPTKQGTMIVLPLRNLTLKIWTESNDFKADLDTHILPNLTFVP